MGRDSRGRWLLTHPMNECRFYCGRRLKYYRYLILILLQCWSFWDPRSIHVLLLLYGNKWRPKKWRGLLDERPAVSISPLLITTLRARRAVLYVALRHAPPTLLSVSYDLTGTSKYTRCNISWHVGLFRVPMLQPSSSVISTTFLSPVPHKIVYSQQQ